VKHEWLPGGVGGATPRVGGAHPRVRGAHPQLGGAHPQVGGALLIRYHLLLILAITKDLDFLSHVETELP
jgi:hypothetical protein